MVASTYRALEFLGYLLRIPLFVAAAFPALVGLYWTESAPGVTNVVVGMATAFAVHCWGSVQNDLLDRQVDRTNARRSTQPIASGAVPPRFAVAVLAVAGAAAVLTTTVAPGRSPVTLALVLAILALFTYYNVLGRRVGWPPMSDAACGLATALVAPLVMLGRGGWDPAILVWTCGYALLIGTMTGFFGGFRDYENDRVHARRTTAGWLLRSRPQLDGEGFVGVRVYGLAVTACPLLFGPVMVAVGAVNSPPGVSPAVVLGTLFCLASMVAVCIALWSFPQASSERVARSTAVFLPLSFVTSSVPIIDFGHTEAFTVIAAVTFLAVAASRSGRGSAEVGYGTSLVSAE